MFCGTLIELLRKPTHAISSRFTKVGLRPGDLLRDRYRVIQVLSRGGWGETYIARDLDRPGVPRCVIKILKPLTEDRTSLDMAEDLFSREAETLGQLGRHQQIPMLLAYFQANGNFYLVQEFIDGLPLDTELTPGLQWSESKVISLLIEVLDILMFVHNQRVIHRDIKPSNLIRRCYDGRLVLIDFGAVKQIRESVVPGQTQAEPLTVSIGTRGYMSIEQLAGRPRLSSDVYALGTICVQALTGIDAESLPRNNDDEVIWQNLTPVTGPVVEIVDKMVRALHRDRYQSAEEVLEDIKKSFPSKVKDYKAASRLNKQPPREDPFHQEDSFILKKYSRSGSSPIPALSAGVLLISSIALVLNISRIQDSMRYTTLASSLKAQNWEAADRETFNLLLTLVGKESEQKGLFVNKEWILFLADEKNCQHVEKIDALWSKASGGQLGLLAQKRLFDEALLKDGSNPQMPFYTEIGWIGRNIEDDFVQLVEWYYDEATNSANYEEGKQPDFVDPVEGHLPAIMYWEKLNNQAKQDRRFDLVNECNL